MSLHRSAEAVTVLQWSRCSDHIGRVHILLLGLASSMVTTILLPFLLGACPQGSCLDGVLNGNFCVIESMIAELTEDGSHHWSHDRASHRRRLIAISRSLAKSTLAPFLGRMPIFLAVHRCRCHRDYTHCLRDQVHVRHPAPVTRCWRARSQLSVDRPVNIRIRVSERSRLVRNVPMRRRSYGTRARLPPHKPP
ncbi:hypothetical protein EDB86DRAFT_2245070 [Lactarius hatsudake]|nr:hypothetical protein EDB86DRAFT_2245070 [Lactarius hatsudake]